MIRYASCVWELQMPTTFRAYQPDQPLLLPLDLQEWVPPGHLAHHVSDVVDALDLTAFYALYEGDGRRNAPYEPSMMVKVLIYAYATGTFSSRAVARKLEEDVAFRMLAAGNFPQHRTVCEFRRRHLAEFSELFVGVVQVAREMGLARFGKLSVDGTKVRANASKRKAMSYERMGKEAARLQAEIEALLTKAGMVDAEEDERWGEDFRGDELPEELQRREKRLAAIQAAKARLEAAQRGRDDERGREPGQDRNPRGGRPYKRAYGEPEPKAQSNFTDPESQIMKTSSEGFQQCSNAQMAVDGEHQIIVATQVGPQASDQGQLVGMLDEINETFGVEPAVPWGLRPSDALAGGRGLSGCSGNPAGLGQPEHAPDGVALRDLSGPGGPAHRQAAGVPPHPQAWKLAQYGRGRVQRAGRACLRGRNGNEDSLERAVSACVWERNEIGATVNWRFTAQDARRKLHRLYPCHY